MLVWQSCCDYTATERNIQWSWRVQAGVLSTIRPALDSTLMFSFQLLTAVGGKLLTQPFHTLLPKMLVNLSLLSVEALGGNKVMFHILQNHQWHWQSKCIYINSKSFGKFNCFSNKYKLRGCMEQGRLIRQPTFGLLSPFPLIYALNQHTPSVSDGEDIPQQPSSQEHEAKAMKLCLKHTMEIIFKELNKM